MTKDTLGIWCNVPKHVIKSNESSIKGNLPSILGLIYFGVKLPILLLTKLSEGSIIVKFPIRLLTGSNS